MWRWRFLSVLLSLGACQAEEALASAGALSLADGALRASSPATAADVPQGAPQVVLTSADEQHVEIRVTFPRVELSGSTDEGMSLHCPGVPSDVDQDGLFWPVWHLAAALPPEGEFRVSAHVSQDRERLGTLADLRPPARGSDDPQTVAQENRSGWSDALGFVQTAAPSVAAGVRILGLRVHPVRADEAGELRGAREVLIRIEFDARGAGRALRSPAASAEATLARLESAVVNPQQVAGWRAAPRPARPLRGESFASSPNPWLRIEITGRGLYRIAWDDLVGLGLDPDRIPLDELRLFCADLTELSQDLPPEQLDPWMNPCALLIRGQSGPTWDENTEVLFLGAGPDGWRDHLGLPASEEDPYYVHPYSDHITYWLTWGGSFESEPLRMAAVPSAPGSRPDVTTGRARVHLEEQRIHESRPRESGLIWERFFWVQLSSGDPPLPISIQVEFDGIVPGTPLDLRASLWGSNWTFTPHSDHKAALMVDGDSLAIVEWERVGRALLEASYVAEAGELSKEVFFVIPPRYYLAVENGHSVRKRLQDTAYLAYLEAGYRRSLRMDADRLDVLLPADSLAAGAVRIGGLADADGYFFLETSRPFAPVMIVPEITASEQGGYDARFALDPAGADAQLLCLRDTQISAPAALSLRTWDGRGGLLRESRDPIDYLVVTTEALREQGLRLAAHRASHFWGADGLTLQSGRTAVVTMEDILDEFAWGQFDPTALRNFLHHAYHNWLDGGAPALSHVVFLGDAHYDVRNHLGRNPGMTVPAYEFYVERYTTSRSLSPAFFGDSWFALLDGPHDRDPEFALGRLPVTSPSEAAKLIDKLIAYDLEAPPGIWKSRLVLAADDVCQGYSTDGIGIAHIEQSEILSREAIPRDLRQEKVYLYDYGSECKYPRKPQATQALVQLVEEGVLLFNFVGHGSETQVADERLLELSTVTGLHNAGRPFVMITASCAVGKFAHGGDGLALAALRHADGGALAVVSASAVAFSNENAVLNNILLRTILSGESLVNSLALGPGYWAAKIAYAPLYVDNEHRYNLLGDPGSRLAVPDHGIELALADVPGVAADADTLLRGASARVHGRVTDRSGQTVAGFNGTVRVEITDSATYNTAVDHLNRRSTYERGGARIFVNEVAVVDGEFELTFFVPTALITGSGGDARIHAYAHTGGGGSSDAAGYRRDLLIPEFTLAVTDTLAPQIDLVWEDPSTPPSAGSRLLATLRDSTGIYVTGLAPSRSVVISIQDEFDRILVAEDLAHRVTFGDDYQEASLTYALPEGLPAGAPLRLTLEASDNVGQRGAAELAFTLAGAAASAAPLLGQVYNLPNPTESETRFLFELDETADVQIAIYTVTGRKIETLTAQQVSPERGRSAGIAWNGRDADGDRLANGVYFYRVVARTGSGRHAERIERLAVYR